MTMVYVIGCCSSGPMKIGISENPDRRRHGLQTGNPALLYTFFSADVGSRKLALELEAHIHEVYSEFRSLGEWFSISSSQAIEAIETTLQIFEHFEARVDL